MNPWKDDIPALPAVSTASEERARAASASPSDIRRPYAAAEVVLPQSAVTHWPLYWEDPYEEMESNGGFRVTYEDYLAIPYVFGRYLGNTVLFPVSAVVDPPWAIMVSDGHPSRCVVGHCHDAARLKSSDTRRCHECACGT